MGSFVVWLVAMSPTLSESSHTYRDGDLTSVQHVQGAGGPLGQKVAEHGLDSLLPVSKLLCSSQDCRVIYCVHLDGGGWNVRKRNGALCQRVYRGPWYWA